MTQRWQIYSGESTRSSVQRSITTHTQVERCKSGSYLATPATQVKKAMVQHYILKHIQKHCLSCLWYKYVWFNIVLV